MCGCPITLVYRKRLRCRYVCMIFTNEMQHLNTKEDIPNLTSNFTDDVYGHNETDHIRIFLEIFTIMGLIAVTANLLIAFVILKYKKMREDATNMIFLQVNILEAFYFLAAPLTGRFAVNVMTFVYDSPVHIITFCVFYEIVSSVVVIIPWFFMLLVCDWQLKVYYPYKYKKFCRVQKLFIIILYIVLISFATITIKHLCFTSQHSAYIPYLLMHSFLILFIIYLIIINIVNVFKKKKLSTAPKKGAIGLTVTNITFFSWTPAVVFVLLNIFGQFNQAPIITITVFSLGLLSPIYNFIYLYRYDENYHVYLRQVFKCRCNEYQNEDLEDQCVFYNDSIGVKITIN